MAVEQLLTAEQVANYLGMHPKTLYKKLRENKMALSFIKLPGRNIGFRPQDIERYIEMHEVRRDGAGTIKTKPRRFRFMTNEEAQEFFAGIERDADGNLLCSPDED